MPEALMVDLGERAYPILFGGNLVAAVRRQADGLVASGRRVAVITDRNVASRQGAALGAMFGDAPQFVAAPGETAKSIAEFGRVLEFLASQRLDRSSAIFAVGGGVVGDLAGFAAASYLRGVDYFQVPTTLLAMVDSSVGGKTGVNLAAGKNLAGAFHQPRGVIISTDLLATLPAREFAAGMAEVIKAGLLKDAALFSALEKAPLTLRSPELTKVIRRCCAIKARIVEADEREVAPDGGRALLNLGHTFGHAIEQATAYGTYLHGEAIAIGLAAAARLSRHLGALTASDVARVESILAAHALPTKLRPPLSIPAVLKAMAHDKKSEAGALRFITLRKIGEAAITRDVPQKLIESVLREIGAK